MALSKLLYQTATRIDRSTPWTAAVLYLACTLNSRLRENSIIGLTNIFEAKRKYQAGISLLSLSNWRRSYYLWYQLAYFHSLKGERRASIEMFEDLLAHTDFHGNIDSDIYAALINLYVEEKNSRKAVETLKRFEGLSHDAPRNGLIWFNAANAYVDLGDYENAIRYNQLALLSKVRVETEVLHNLGHCYLQMRKHNESIRCFSEALSKARSKAQEARAQFGLACNYREVGDVANARAHFEKSLERGYAKASEGLKELEEKGRPLSGTP